MRGPLVHTIFFLSGIAGLVYQVVWVRQFGLVFGNTIHSAALVSGVFVCGLGLGSWAAGLLSDRRYAAEADVGLRLYALAELGIAALGLALALLLPHLGDWSAAISSYSLDARGWHVLSAGSLVLRYLTALALLAPVTLLMGATLTLLIRHLVRSDLAAAGWRIGLLYGFNTAGAALGALLVDLALVPTGGLLRTQLFAVALNVIAGLGALGLRAGGRRSPAPQEVSEPPPGAAPGDRASRQVMLAVFVSGLAGMGMEILWFRFLTSAVGQFRVVFSVLLAVILLGIWLGSVAAGWLTRRYGRPARLFAASQIAFALCTILCFLLFDESRAAPPASPTAEAGALGRLLSAAASISLPTLRLVALPAFFMGFSFPLANAAVQTSELAVGRRAGLLYLGNTLGSVTGSLAAGFLLLPLGGIKWSGLVLIVCAALAPLPLLRAVRAKPAALRATPGDRRLRAVTAFGVLLTAAGLVGWSALPREDFVLRSFGDASDVGEYLREPYLLTASEGILESIVILDVPGRGGRTLYTNGHSMSATSMQAQRYMRAFAHVPLSQMESPREVLVICFGVGNTLHAASLHPSVERLEIVDLSQHVLEQAHYFAATNGDVLADERVTVYVNDGRQHLRMRDDAVYDLVTLEPPPIEFAGVASLYSREFYALARSRLRPGGMLTQWLPIHDVPGAVARSMIRAMLDVFPDTVLLGASYGDLILLGVNGDPPRFDPARHAAALAERPAVAADLARYEMGSALELAAMFAGSARTLEAATADVPALTDDHPILEYARSWFDPGSVPREIFDSSDVRGFCPDCFVDGRPAPGFERLPVYLRILQTIHDDPHFWERGRSGSEAYALRFPPRLMPAVRRTVAGSPYLQRLLPGLAAPP